MGTKCSMHKCIGWLVRLKFSRISHPIDLRKDLTRKSTMKSDLSEGTLVFVERKECIHLWPFVRKLSHEPEWVVQGAGQREKERNVYICDPLSESWVMSQSEWYKVQDKEKKKGMYTFVTLCQKAESWASVSGTRCRTKRKRKECIHLWPFVRKLSHEPVWVVQGAGQREKERRFPLGSPA